ncbi:Fe-Mn family superoxide dismutase [Burkholderia vietnamiensis]|nr:Fe-Mn family superoxide dismutase [Burkholderia vietnamiensis]
MTVLAPAASRPAISKRHSRRDFGSVERWGGGVFRDGQGARRRFRLGAAHVVAEASARLVNQWASDHTHTLADGAPVLALDMYEHSYHIDFGAKAAAYVDAFMENINWTNVADRFASVSG